MIKLKFIIIFIFLLLNNVYALGVSPGSINLNFKPEYIGSFEIEVVNSPPKDGDVEVYISFLAINETIREEFKDVLNLDKTKISFTKDIPSEKIKVLVKYPKGFSKAGIHELNVGARPIVEGGEGLATRAGSEVRVFLNVSDAYANPRFAIPKKLSILSVSAKPVKQGEKAEVEIQIKSEAEEVLKKVYGRVKLVYNGQDLASADTKIEDIFPGETRVLTAIFYTNSFPITSLPLNAEVFYGNSIERGTGMLTIIQGVGSEESQICKSSKCSWCWFWIAILIVIIIIILYLWLFRGKGKGGGGSFGSYDFSSESKEEEP